MDKPKQLQTEEYMVTMDSGFPPPPTNEDLGHAIGQDIDRIEELGEVKRNLEWVVKEGNDQY